jgi:hypothetical protein
VLLNPASSPCHPAQKAAKVVQRGPSARFAGARVVMAGADSTPILGRLGPLTCRGRQIVTRFVTPEQNPQPTWFRNDRAKSLIYWRKGWDSNPRYPCRHAGFQDRCLKPLGHPSKPLKLLKNSASAFDVKVDLLTSLLTNAFYFARLLIAARRSLSMPSIASACMFGRTWLYKSSVIAMLLWPSRSLAIFG